MKIFYLLIFLLFMNACSSNKVAYWCGDHQCIDKKEKSEYFQKNMIIEVRNINKNNKYETSEYEKILTQSQSNQKDIIVNNKNLSNINKSEEKFRIKEEKRLSKALRLKEKKRIKNERKLAKINKNNEKKRIKNERKLAKKNKNIEEKIPKNKVTKNKILKTKKSIDPFIESSNSFSDLINKVKEKNYNKPFPDINDIPF